MYCVPKKSVYRVHFKHLYITGIKYSSMYLFLIFHISYSIYKFLYKLQINIYFGKLYFITFLKIFISFLIYENIL